MFITPPRLWGRCRREGNVRAGGRVACCGALSSGHGLAVALSKSKGGDYLNKTAPVTFPLRSGSRRGCPSLRRYKQLVFAGKDVFFRLVSTGELAEVGTEDWSQPSQWLWASEAWRRETWRVLWSLPGRCGVCLGEVQQGLQKSPRKSGNLRL